MTNADPRSFSRLLKSELAALPGELEMVPLPGPFEATVTPPGSKSITNRALLLAALAEGESHLEGALLDADDARVMTAALRQLGATVEIEDESRGVVRVVGTGGRLKGNCTLNLNNAGTATRFLTAAACLADGPVEIDGNARMRQRPIGELVGLLREIGVSVEELGAPGCVPVRVHPLRAMESRPTVKVGRTASSQFVSALVIVGPVLSRGLKIEFTSTPTSGSYIDMTLAMIAMWAEKRPEGSVEAGSVEVAPCTYRARDYAVEPDASGATYFWAAGAIVPGSCCGIPITRKTSIQSDSQFAKVLGVLGASVLQNSVTAVSAAALQSTNTDLTLMPDAAMTLAAVACFAKGTTTITGLRTLRDKETDRIAAICAELSKIGVRAEAFGYTDARGAPDEGVRITPPQEGIDLSPGAPRVEFETYDDHRMAMSLALIGLRRPNVVIRDPGCVAKTYPSFWRDLSALYDSALAARDTGSGA